MSTSDNASISELDRAAPQELFSAGLTGVLRSAKSLVTNGPYVFTILYITFDSIVVLGLTAFGAKYLQQQFGLTAAIAGMVFGQFPCHHYAFI